MNTSKALRILSDDILNSNFVGFDRFFDHFANVPTNSYPPHNVINVGEDKREIEFALAGFSSDDVEIEVKDGILSITGEKTVEDDKEYIWRGISSRKFVKQFSLTDYWARPARGRKCGGRGLCAGIGCSLAGADVCASRIPSET